MKILSIGTDRKIFEKDSAVRARVLEYGGLFDELHIIVFSLCSLNLKKEQIAPNVWIYPTSSSSRLFYIKDAVRLTMSVWSENKMTVDNTVITCQDPFETGEVGRRIKKMFGVPLHIQIHTDLYSPYFKKESLKNRLRILISQKVLAKADAVRVVSKKIADSVVSKKVSRVIPEVLPIFVDVGKIENEAVSEDMDLKKKYPQFKFTILMASRLTKEKNIFLAFHALKKILTKYPAVGLVVVGSGPMESGLKDFVAREGLTHNVIFESWQENMFSYYKTANIFWVTSNYEGYGMTIVEAVSAHCPTISTDVGVASDILRDGDVFVCPVGDVNCFFEKTKKFIENVGLRESFASEAFFRLSRVTYKSKKEYLDSYKKNIESAQEYSKKNK